MPLAHPHPAAAQSRHGQVMVEFAVVAFVLYLLLAGTLEFGRAIYSAQVLQHSADLCAREISRTPLSPTSSFSDAMQDDTVTATVYDKHKLVIRMADVGAGPDALNNYFKTLPLINQQLRALMIADTIDNGVQVLRYPGAVRKDGNASDPRFPYFVVVPIVTRRAADGAETIEYVDVVENLSQGAASTDPFPLSSSSPSGVVALRLNFPYQAATLSGFQNSGTAKNAVIQARDGEVAASDPNQVLGSSTAVASEGAIGFFENGKPVTITTNAGPYGLGSQNAWGTQVRPFRKVLSAQAIYRREVFK